MKSVNAYCDQLKRANPEADRNERGNAVYRGFFPTDRYLIDFADDFQAEGWLQFDTDQDAHYFGCWVNPQSFRVLTYAEGDWTLCECGDREHYNAEIRSMLAFYGEGRIALAIDQDGTATEYRQDRSDFLLPE